MKYLLYLLRMRDALLIKSTAMIETSRRYYTYM